MIEYYLAWKRTDYMKKKFISISKVNEMWKKVSLLNEILNDLNKEQELLLTEIKKNSIENILKKLNLMTFLINYYSEKKYLYEVEISNLFAIINANNEKSIPYFIECWEKEVDLLEKAGKFEFQKIDIKTIKYKKVK